MVALHPQTVARLLSAGVDFYLAKLAQGEHVMLFILGAVSGFAAFWVGRWRGLCQFFALKAPWNVPTAWFNPLVRFGTWVLVVAASLVFATCWTRFFVESVHPIFGKFSWLIWALLLLVRWLASGVSAGKEGWRQLDGMRSTDCPDDNR